MKTRLTFVTLMSKKWAAATKKPNQIEVRGWNLTIDSEEVKRIIQPLLGLYPEIVICITPMQTIAVIYY